MKRGNDDILAGQLLVGQLSRKAMDSLFNCNLGSVAGGTYHVYAGGHALKAY